MSNESTEWITAAEARRRLGLKRVANVYQLGASGRLETRTVPAQGRGRGGGPGTLPTLLFSAASVETYRRAKLLRLAQQAKALGV